MATKKTLAKNIDGMDLFMALRDYWTPRVRKIFNSNDLWYKESIDDKILEQIEDATGTFIENIISKYRNEQDDM